VVYFVYSVYSLGIVCIVFVYSLYCVCAFFLSVKKVVKGINLIVYCFHASI
jgi:hypothetical protein